MAFPTMQYQQELATQRFANALYDTQVGSETLNNVLGDMSALGGAAAAFNAYYTFSFGNMSTAQVAEMLADNLGIVVGQNGIDDAARNIALAVAEDELNAVPAEVRGATVSALLEGWGTAFLADPTFGAAAAAFNAEVDTAMQYTGAADVTVGTDTEVTDFYLTSGQDILTGTASDDNFSAPLAQNPWAGGMSNTLSSSDVLDGGAGDDVLNANLVPEFFGAAGESLMDIQPTIKNIETIQLQAQDSMWYGGATFDAKDVTDVVNIGSFYSDGDLVIENLTTLTSGGALRNTDSITVTMDHTDNFNSDGDASDLIVLFDDDYLISGKESEFTLDLRIVNAYQLAENNDPLVAFLEVSFRAGADLVTVDIESAQTYADVVNLINAELNSQGIDATATSLPLRNAVFTDDIGSYKQGNVAGQYAPIRLTSNALELTSGPILIDSNVEDFDGLNTWTNATAHNDDLPVAVNVELHKVGRAGEGGNLVIGGKFQSEGHYGSGGKGVSVINVEVLGDASKPSDLGFIATTNGKLDTVNIATAPILGSDGYASLTIRDGFSGGTYSGWGLNTQQDSLTLVNADAFFGDLTLGTDTAVQNLATLTAQGGGDVTFIADIDIENVYTYTTGGGDDVIDIELDTDAIDTINTGLTINTNAGDDKVWLDGTGLGSQLTMEALDNVHINTGAGDDFVYIYNEVRTNIHAGTGSDFVEFAGGDSGTWAFGQPTGPQVFGERVLYQAKLTLTFAGFESTVSVNTDANGNFVADQMIINAAIADAIAQNPELDRLLDVVEGDGYQQIFVSSTVGGENDLRVEINQPEMVTATPTAGQVQIPTVNFNQLVQGIIDTTALNSDALTTATAVETAMNSGSNFAGANFNGNIGANGAVGADYQAYTSGGSTDGGVVNYSVVNMGSGSNDLLVLDSNGSSSNVIVIDQSFGKVSVVNFHDDSPNDVTAYSQVGNHALDFTSYLDNKIDPSATTNEQSATPIAVTLNTNAQLTGSPASTGTALANSVNMLNFDETVTNSISFANLTAANLVDALNGTAGTTVTGGLADSDLDAVATTTNLIYNVQKHIVMVENNQNVGEYKVFYLTSTVDTTTNTTDGDFDAASAQLLGTMDFGNSINFQLVGSTAYADLRNDLLATADNVEPGPGPGPGPGPDEPGTDFIDVDATDDALVFAAQDDVVETFTFAEGNYAYTIDNFDIGTDVMDLPDVPAPTLINTDFTDGEAIVQWAADGNVIEVTLTGLTTAEDGSLLFIESFGDSIA